MKLDPKKIGTWASAVAGVAGIAWAVVKAVLWAGALTASIHASEQDIKSMNTRLGQLTEQQRDRDDDLKDQIRLELRYAASERASTAAALEALKAEVRVRAERSSAADVQRAAANSDTSITMAAEASRRSADSAPLTRHHPPSIDHMMAF